MTKCLTDIDPEGLTPGQSVSVEDVVFDLRDSTLRDVGQVWVHRILPEACLPRAQLLDALSRANSSTTFCKILGVCRGTEPLQLVLPSHSTLLSSMIAGGTLSTERGLRCALDVCRCLVELHEHSIHCGVLRPADVLVSATGCCSINTCSVVANSMCSSVFTHPSYFTYMAPEVIMCKFFVNGMKADVWSLACCICRMFDPDSPWPASASAQDYCRKVHSSPPTLPGGLPSSLADLVRQCFALSMPERPTVKEVLQGLEAAVSASNLAGMDELPQQVSQGAVEQASCAQQADNTTERDLANARAKVKQLERKLHELVLRSNERDEQQQKRILKAEKEVVELRQERASLQDKLRSALQARLQGPPSVAAANAAPVEGKFEGQLCAPPRRPRTRKPSGQFIPDVKEAVKELDQHTSGSSASPERPRKRFKTNADPSAAPEEGRGLRHSSIGANGSGTLDPTGEPWPIAAPARASARHSLPGSSMLKVEPEDEDVEMKSAGGNSAKGHEGAPLPESRLNPPSRRQPRPSPVFRPPPASGSQPPLHPADPTTPRVPNPNEPLSAVLKSPSKGSHPASHPCSHSPHPFTRTRSGMQRPSANGAGAETSHVPSQPGTPVAVRGSRGEEASRGPTPHGTPGTKSGVAALLELARAPTPGLERNGKDVASFRTPGLREGKTGSEQSASSSSLTRREPPSPRAINQIPAASRPPLAGPRPVEQDPLPAPGLAGLGTAEDAAGVPAPSSNSASISTTANVEGPGQLSIEQQQQQDATSADCLLTDPKMLIVLLGLSYTRVPLREDTSAGGVLGLIMFCLNKAVSASTSKSQQALKGRLLQRSKQVLSQMVTAGWIVKEDGRYLLDQSATAVRGALESASEDEQRKAKESFVQWCRKTFVDEVADSRIINQSRLDLLINNTPHYLAWLATITKLGPPQGLNEGAINLLHDTVMCYHCPDIAGSPEFMVACKALADMLQAAEKKNDKAALMRKIYTCMAAAYLNRSMASEAEDMAGRAIAAQPKSPDLESAYWIQGAARYNLAQFSNAEESFQKALKHYQNKVAGGMHHMRTLDFLADVRSRQGKWKEARKTYEEEVQVGQLRTGGVGPAEQEKAHASLARLLMAMGLFAEAGAHFKEAFTVLEQAGTLSFAAAEYCELRAVVLAEQYKVDSAIKCLEKAEEIRRSLQERDGTSAVPSGGRMSAGAKELSGGEEPVSVAPTTLVNMARVAVMNAKYDEAEDYCDEVIGLDLEGADDEAAALQLQGQLFVMQHRFKEAKNKLTRVQALLADSTDMDKLAMLHYWLAQALSHLPGEETAAEDVLINGMQMLREKWPGSSLVGGAAEYLNPRLECLLGQLQAARGSVNDEQAVKTEGLKRCKAGVEAAVKVWGRHHPYFASCLRHVAWAQMACFSYEAALVTLAEERKVWQSMEGGREGLEYAGLAHARAHCHYALQRYTDAERLYRAAADIFRKVYPNSSLHKWSMVGALAALQDNPSPSRAPQEVAIQEVCEVVGCNQKKLMQWLDRHRQYWNPAGRR